MHSVSQSRTDAMAMQILLRPSSYSWRRFCVDLVKSWYFQSHLTYEYPQLPEQRGEGGSKRVIYSVSPRLLPLYAARNCNFFATNYIESLQHLVRYICETEAKKMLVNALNPDSGGVPHVA